MLTDATDSNPGDGLVDDGSGNITLRAAIQEANARWPVMMTSSLPGPESFS